MPPRVQFAVDDRAAVTDGNAPGWSPDAVDHNSDSHLHGLGSGDPHSPQGPQRLHNELLSLMRSLRTADPIHRKSAPNTPDNPLPRFSDLSDYGLNDLNEAQLWELEATRLVASLDEPHSSIQPASTPFFGQNISTDGFAQLEKLAEQLLCALAICGLDDGPKILFSRPNQSRNAADEAIIAKSFLKLETRLQADPSVRRMNQLRQVIHTSSRRRQVSESSESSKSSESSDLDDDERDGGPESQVVNDGAKAVAGNDGAKAVTVLHEEEEVAAEHYHLVDYITATVARLMTIQLRSHEIYGRAIIIKAIAKLSTKLKVLFHRLSAFGLDALHRHEKLRQSFRGLERVDNQSDLSVRFGARAIYTVDNQRDDYKHMSTYTSRYVSEMSEVSAWLLRMMWRVSRDLVIRETRGRAVDEFDISFAVYPTGSQDISTMAFQNRRGHLSGSTSAVAVGLSHRAFTMLYDVAAQTHSRALERGGSGPSSSTLTIKTHTDGMGDKVVEMRSMADAISAMVSLSCMDPSINESLRIVCSTVHVSSIVTDLHAKARGFTAFASLCNKPPISRTGLPSQPRELQRGRSLSQSILARDSIRVPTALRDLDSRSADRSWGLVRAGERALYSSRSMRNRIAAAAQHWGVEENAVVIDCRRYTVGIMSVCATLVIGGLAVGFLVGSRIDGVDPFNLTMFSWIIAGFIILIAKAVRVAEWSWRDFLKGRVRCRSVHELATNTGLDDQGIIMHLLSLEDELPIFTKGPYNRVFSRGDYDGFSIDVKPTIGTLVASGILVVQVLTEWGPALVCLDLRAHGSVLFHDEPESLPGSNHHHDRQRMVHDQRRMVLRLVCKDPPTDADIKKDIVFQRQYIQWEKIVGLYDDMERKVW